MQQGLYFVLHRIIYTTLNKKNKNSLLIDQLVLVNHGVSNWMSSLFLLQLSLDAVGNLCILENRNTMDLLQNQCQRPTSFTSSSTVCASMKIDHSVAIQQRRLPYAHTSHLSSLICFLTNRWMRWQHDLKFMWMAGEIIHVLDIVSSESVYVGEADEERKENGEVAIERSLSGLYWTNRRGDDENHTRGWSVSCSRLGRSL